MKAPFEKLGSFFLGSEYDLDKNQITNDIVQYDARDLTTHAVCVGMTGSGKTGLCICLLEEAAIDKVPAIIIDPKGDITNHLLHFPDLLPTDFEPWINPDDARRKKKTPKEYAQQISETWKTGLLNWGIEKQRIQLLADSVDYTIYTPGSSKGIPVNILSSLNAPKIGNEESLNNLIIGTTSAILSLIENTKDPILSKEGILLSKILEYYWSKKQDLTLEKLISEFMTPPFQRIGIFDLETFYSSEKRLEFALQLNTLLASPRFNDWLHGDQFDISQLLYTEKGQPRHSIFSLAHLGDEERMFFITLLLEQLSTWMYNQSGTTSLRALMYFDEVFGYMPPVANPPSKSPLLRLLKQARAYGLGIVLSTQNPVDLDYKGLSNTGTWFIGKLQTERDKKRLLDGLQSIESQFNEKQTSYSDIISQLDSRVFLLHNIHNEEPIIIHSRWAMNYLRGPLTGSQISQLMDVKKEPIGSIQHKESVSSVNKPNVNQKIEQYYIEQRKNNQLLHSRTDDSIVVDPKLLIDFSVRFFDKKRGIDKIEQSWALLPKTNKVGKIEWDELEEVEQRSINSQSVYSSDKIQYNDLPAYMNNLNELKQIRKEFSDYLYRTKKHSILSHSKLKLYQEQDETKQDFLIKVKQKAREERDEEIDKLEKKYGTKLDRINDRIDRLSASLESDQAEYSARKREEVLGAGETVLGVLLGRRRTTGVTAASRRRRMTTKTKHKISKTKNEIDDLQNDLKELESELGEQIDTIIEKWEALEDDTSEFTINPRRTDVQVNDPKIAWVN